MWTRLLGERNFYDLNWHAPIIILSFFSPQNNKLTSSFMIFYLLTIVRVKEVCVFRLG